jgi:hypothetical protein
MLMVAPQLVPTVKDATRTGSVLRAGSGGRGGAGNGRSGTQGGQTGRYTEGHV